MSGRPLNPKSSPPSIRRRTFCITGPILNFKLPSGSFFILVNSISKTVTLQAIAGKLTLTRHGPMQLFCFALRIWYNYNINMNYE